MNGKPIINEEFKTETARIYHPFGPLYNENSHVLILGSFPSVKSREKEFFYGHPQNRFWKVIAAVFEDSAKQIHSSGPEHSGDRTGAVIGAARAGGSWQTDPGKAGVLMERIRIPHTIDEKKDLILSNGIALWDSIASCEITGSSDASIRNAEPNDLSVITDSCDIRDIFCNGKKSLEVYNKYILPVLGRKATALPSTSPANAAWSLERLIEAWSVIRRV